MAMKSGYLTDPLVTQPILRVQKWSVALDKPACLAQRLNWQPLEHPETFKCFLIAFTAPAVMIYNDHGGPGHCKSTWMILGKNLAGFLQCYSDMAKLSGAMCIGLLQGEKHEPHSTLSSCAPCRHQKC